MKLGNIAKGLAVSGLALTIMAGPITASAFDLSSNRDETNAKLYWHLPFGGDRFETGGEKAHFGLAVMEDDNGNQAFAQALSGHVNQFAQRPAMFDMKFDSGSFELTGLSVNGVNFTDPSAIKLGQAEGGTTIFGMAWWQAGLMVAGLAGSSYIIVSEMVDDEDDDAPVADEGGGGTGIETIDGL